MSRRPDAVIAVALLTASSPAFAHGVDALFQSLVIVGMVLGLIGGAASAGLRFKFLLGIEVTLAVLFAGGLVYALVILGPSSDPFGDIGAMALLLVVFAALPLGAGFAVAFAATSLLRNRFWAQRSRNEPAP